jgi:hypothetical protein
MAVRAMRRGKHVPRRPLPRAMNWRLGVTCYVELLMRCAFADSID